MKNAAQFLKYYKQRGPMSLPFCGIALLLLMLVSPLALAGPDCDKKPDNPSCISGVFTPVDITAVYVYNDGAVDYFMEEASPYDGPYPQTNPPFDPPLDHHPFGEGGAGWDDWVENTLSEVPPHVYR